MKLFADTIINIILDEVRDQQGTFRYVLPGYPSEVLVRIGEQLEEVAGQNLHHNVKVSYGIAYRLGEKWRNSDDEKEKENFHKIKEKGWYNEDDNLTSLRNQIRDPDTDCLIVLLAGYEWIDDKESLRDFFRLNQETVWQSGLKKDFINWIETTLINELNPDDSQEEFRKISNILIEIYNAGLSDLIKISTFLETRKFDAVMFAKDATDIILSSLESFGLPNLTGIRKGKAKRNFSRYISDAHSFYNYSVFLDRAPRNRSLATIKKYRASLNTSDNDEAGQLGKEVLGEFNSRDELLDTLEDYIEYGSEDKIALLKSADFIFISDKVLGYKEKNVVASTREKKIQGNFLEVFLEALWDSFRSFKTEQDKDGELSREIIEKISFKGHTFRHDFDTGTDDEEGITPDDKAVEFLKRLLGGIDTFLEERVRIKKEGSDEFIRVDSELVAKNKDSGFKYQKSVRSEPLFRFWIFIETNEGNRSRYDFSWSLPRNHQSRLVVILYEWLEEHFSGHRNLLPAFTTQYIPELFSAKDSEEAVRLMEHCIRDKNSRVVDLTEVASIEEHEAKALLEKLSYNYQNFISRVLMEGFYSALVKDYGPLRQSYAALFNYNLQNKKISTIAPLLFKSFLLLPESKGEMDWAWKKDLDGAVVTPLHPAMLELMFHQSIYLCNFFSESAKNAIHSSSRKAFGKKFFAKMIDFSKIQWPLYGILSGKGGNLNTDSKSFDYIHLLGNVSLKSSGVGSKILLEHEEPEEEDEEQITDSNLFRETRTSILIHQILSNYCTLYNFASDGISVAAYCGGEIQPLIAAINAHVSEKFRSNPERPHSLELTIFSDQIDDFSVMRWINAWKERWQVPELSSGARHYNNSNISIKYRVVSSGDNYDHFRRIMMDDDYDLFFFTDFMKTTNSRFQALEDLGLDIDYQKFPVVEKISTRTVGVGEDTKRERILSNDRFQLNNLHGEVMANILMDSSASKRHVVVSISDFEPWIETINSAHKISGWVVCIDPSIDEQLLRLKLSEEQYSREIIGFGTGVGAHGENNYTVSTDQFSVVDIEKKILSTVHSVLGPIELPVAEKISRSLVKEAPGIAGLSLMNATGSERFVRELIANALTRKILKKDTEVFCDELVSLDSFLHWFDDPSSTRRPDLLRIQASIIDGHFNIKMQIIECKLANQTDAYLEKAREQVESGLSELVEKFRPRLAPKPDHYARVDQRYWWMQLHRLISSKGNTTKANSQDTLIALERLSEGFFSVNWQVGILAFWLDKDSADLTRETSWQYSVGDKEFPIVIGSGGIEFIKRVSLEDQTLNLFNDILPVTYSLLQETSKETSHLKHSRELTDLTIAKGESQTKLEQSSKIVPLRIEIDKSKVAEQKKDMVVEEDHVMDERPYPFERIFLGPGTSGGRDAYWEFGHPDLPNRHILVFGASGTGKTYLIQALMCELAKLGRNNLVVDYTNGFINSQLEDIVKENLKPKQHNIKMNPLEINPFRKQINYIDDTAYEEDPASIASRVSGIFDEVYQLGDQQRSALYNAIRDGVTTWGNSFNLKQLIERLEILRDEGGLIASASTSVISKIQPFVDMNPFGVERSDSWEHIFSDVDSRTHVIQLAGFIKNAARLITEFALTDLYWYYRASGNKDDSKVVILDEIQNLDHKLDSPLGQLLTEGRKFGFSLILATQTLSNLDKEERDRLFQASHKMFFRPADTEIKSFAQILSDATGRRVEEWINMLSTLKRGECYSLGYAYNEQNDKLEVNRYFRIKVSDLASRYH